MANRGIIELGTGLYRGEALGYSLPGVVSNATALWTLIGGQ